MAASCGWEFSENTLRQMISRLTSRGFYKTRGDAAECNPTIYIFEYSKPTSFLSLSLSLGFLLQPLAEQSVRKFIVEKGKRSVLPMPTKQKPRKRDKMDGSLFFFFVVLFSVCRSRFFFLKKQKM